MSRDIILFQLILHEAARNAEELGRLGLNEIRPYQGTPYQSGFDLVQRIRQIQLHRQKINSAFELRLFIADIGRKSRQTEWAE